MKKFKYDATQCTHTQRARKRKKERRKKGMHAKRVFFKLFHHKTRIRMEFIMSQKEINKYKKRGFQTFILFLLNRYKDTKKTHTKDPKKLIL